jgi:hypothetical protein
MAELAQIIGRVSAASFATDLLEADEVLWGSFWHFDVISPGYRLPAVELALLRATRLDGHWPPNTSIEEYLADLHQTIRHPQARLWLLSAAGEPCVVVAAPTSQAAGGVRGVSSLFPTTSTDETQYEIGATVDKKEQVASKNPESKIQNPELATVVWYCASTGQLHAGYRTTTRSLHATETVEQYLPGNEGQAEGKMDVPPSWLVLTAEQDEVKADSSLAARLDAEILRWRLKGFVTPKP